MEALQEVASPNKKFKTGYIVYTILILVIISLGIYSYLQFASLRKIQKGELTRLVLMTKDITGGKIVAYRLTDKWSQDSDAGVYAIRLESGDEWPVIFSSVRTAYVSANPDENKLFDVLNNNEIWLVNDQTNRVEVYSPGGEDELIYKRSVDLPNYAIGKIYGIKCETNICTIYTARDRESLCTMKLDVVNESFYDIKCSDMGGDFIPEKL